MSTTTLAVAEPDHLAGPMEAAPGTRPLPERRGLTRRVLGGVDSLWDWMFGVVAVVVLLALLASFPLLQVLSLGYLLAVAGRVGLSGRLRDGVIGVRKAARVGSLVAGAWLLMMIPRFLASLWTDAVLIDPYSTSATILGIATPVAFGYVLLHIAAAAWRGGRLRHFLWPRPIRFLRQLLSGDAWRATIGAATAFTASLRLPSYFWLGLQGMIGGLLWLALPTTLLVAGLEHPIAGVAGGLLLAAVVLVLPFLQARMAATGRFGEMLAVRSALGTYLRAPVASLVAMVATLVLAVPLYLLKVELIPREAVWLPSLLFVVSVWPARVLAGLAVARADRAPRRWWRSALSGISFVAFLVPLALLYVVVLYLTQYLSWYGMWSLYEQHAFLVPVPFLGL